MKYICLIDCNNFFVAAETLFAPHLQNGPVVVLSSGDGCVISRSHRAKEIGIQMGQPYFQCKDLLQKYDGTAFSSNFALYSDLSRRIFQILAGFGYPMEIYSIDEAFLEIESSLPPLQIAKSIREKVKKWTGITVSIGMSQTKTLAKLAGEKAKQRSDGLLFYDSHCPQAYAHESIKDVWGIGRKIWQRLDQLGIRTVGKFMNKDAFWVKKHFSITLGGC